MSSQTFLPADYLAQKAERRTNLVCLTLFVVVMLAVFGAFVMTNRQWSSVKDRQNAINVEYQQAALKIEKLNELDQQRDAILDKAEIAGALVERVPRSILLAELINRMPPRLGLLKLHLESEKIRSTRATADPNATGNLKGPERGRTRKDVADMATKIEPLRYQVTLTMVGAAPTDIEVTRYLAELNSYSLLEDVTLEYSEEKEIQGQVMREFRIKMVLDPTADVRYVEPKVVPRINKNPMTDTVEFGVPLGGPRKGRSTASATPARAGGSQ